MSDATKWLVIVAAVGVAAVFLVSLVRRMGWERLVRAAWDDVLGCAVESARVIRTRPRVLWPAGVLMALVVLSWVVSAASMVRHWGIPFWRLLALRMQGGTAATLDSVVRDLVSGLYREPGTVASYLWPWTGGLKAGDVIASLAVLIALAVTVRSWLPAAHRARAGPSARLLHSLLGPMLAIEALGIALLVAMAMGVFKVEDTRRWFFAILAVPAVIPMAAWLAGVRGALFTAVARAIGKQEPWAPPVMAAGALRHFRALFWLALLIEGLRMLGSLALADWTSGTSPAWTSSVAQLQQAIFTVSWGIASWTYVVLALAPAAAVSEDVGPLDSVRLALRAWWRAPLHLVMVIMLGMAALSVAWLTGRMILSASVGSLVGGRMILEVSVGSVVVAIILRLLGLAVQAVAITWAAAGALLLWQRVRGRVMAGEAL